MVVGFARRVKSTAAKILKREKEKCEEAIGRWSRVVSQTKEKKNREKSI